MRGDSTTPELRVFGKEPPKRVQLLPNAVLGMLIFIIAEAMLFAGFISAFIIVKANATEGMWPPPGQPLLPAAATGFNTALLLASGGVMWWAGRNFDKDAESAVRPFRMAWGLGALFVALQGREWIALLGDGLSMTSSTYGAFFYLIVGTHGLHAVGSLIALGVAHQWMSKGELSKDGFRALRMFWYFVVLLWPVLYWQVYL